MSPFLLASVLVSSSKADLFRIPNAEEVKLLKAIRSASVQNLKPYITTPVRLQLVWDVAGFNTQKALDSRFSKQQQHVLYPRNVVFSGYLISTTSEVVGADLLEDFAGAVSLDLGRDSARNKIFYHRGGGEEVLARMPTGSTFFICDIKTDKNKKVALKRLELNGHSLDFDEFWMNR
jgi:hypothetical protein